MPAGLSQPSVTFHDQTHWPLPSPGLPCRWNSSSDAVSEGLVMSVMRGAGMPPEYPRTYHPSLGQTV